MISLFFMVKKFLAFLNTNETAENISYSLTLALIFSVIPLTVPAHLLIIIALIAFNGNLLIFLFVAPVLSRFTPSMYYELHQLGEFILLKNQFLPFFQYLSDIPFLIFFNWNNSVTMGSYIFCVISSIPIYYFYLICIKKYQLSILPILKQSKLFNLVRIPNWLLMLNKK